MKLFLDTNIFIRYLSADNETQFQYCKTIFEKISLGLIIPYTSGLVFFETFYVLTSIYKFPKKEVAVDIKKMFRLRNLVIIKKVDIERALGLYMKIGIKLADCAIGLQVPKNVLMCTYDKDFDKLDFVTKIKPNKVLEKFEN